MHTYGMVWQKITEYAAHRAAVAAKTIVCLGRKLLPSILAWIKNTTDNTKTAYFRFATYPLYSLIKALYEVL